MGKPFRIIRSKKNFRIKNGKFASQKASPEDIAAIELSLKNMRKAIGDIPKMMEMGREFHINIAKAVHNDLLFLFAFNLISLLEERLWVNMKGKTCSFSSYSEKYIKEHSTIFGAIKNKNKVTARKAMYSHLNKIEENMLELAE